MDEHKLKELEDRLDHVYQREMARHDKTDALCIALALACLGLITLSAVASAIILAVKL